MPKGSAVVKKTKKKLIKSNSLQDSYDNTDASVDETNGDTENAKSFKKALIIVESPSKAKTLKKYLGSKFEIKASVGHIKDLPKSKLGVDIDNNFTPTYEVIKGKEKVITELTKAAASADIVYLAADPDREGEAIAWHIAEHIKKKQPKIQRVLFNEITKSSVIEALKHPMELNKDKFESQQTRRILDRLVGYKISPLLWVKVQRGLSAGRVQSVAVKIIREREEAIQKFVSKTYYSIISNLEAQGKKFKAKLVKINNTKLDRTDLDDKTKVDAIVDELRGKNPSVLSVQKKERKRQPYPPFITSTLQQEAAKQLYFSPKKTMLLAQKLYEGVELGKLGTEGLITYMRTDSLRISPEALTSVRSHIENSYGKKYLPDTPLLFKNKKNIQDAHEAIRPTNILIHPKDVEPHVEADLYKLYDLIWRRFVASQMTPSLFEQTSVDIVYQLDATQYFFRATGQIPLFDGFLKVWQEGRPQAVPVVEDSLSISDEKENPDAMDEGVYLLPDMKEKEVVTNLGVLSFEHQTQPPPRFSESTLIKELEEEGIGRPSTYATILTTIQDRKYVEKRDNRLFPTELGILVTDLLNENFPTVLDLKFTAEMENQLDEIEEGHVRWVDTLKKFYSPFSELLSAAQEKMRNIKKEEVQTNLTCPQCKEKPVIIKWGRNGKFAACQGYPECRFTSDFKELEDGSIEIIAQVTVDETCPKCQSPMTLKQGRYGKFLACSKYPECKTTKPITTKIQCPLCKEGELAQKSTRFGKIFYSCTKYPTCTYAIWDKPLKDTSCPTCAFPFLVEHYTKKEGQSIRCPNKECKFEKAS